MPRQLDSPHDGWTEAGGWEHTPWRGVNSHGAELSYISNNLVALGEGER